MVDSLVRRTGWWVFGSLLVLAGCRSHVLEDGPYTLEPTTTLRDDCGLAGADLWGDAALRTEGHVVSLALAGAGLTLTGTYRYGTESFTLDGALLDHPMALAGRACRLETAAFHLDGEAVGPGAFTGAMSLALDALQDPACTCRYWFNLDARRR